MGRCRGKCFQSGDHLGSSRCNEHNLMQIYLQTEDSWYTYENYMMNQKPEDLPELKATINSEDYLDGMSAPRIDPARPEMTGWAMKQNRQKQMEGSSESEDES